VLVVSAFLLSGPEGATAAELTGSVSASTEGASPHAAAREPERAAQHCLTRQEQRARIAARTVVPLAQAARAARGRGGELLNARLCERDGKLVYLLTVLARSGKVLRVAVDAGTGALVDASH
jgi:uncharacterized membrane protein YkoI